MKKLILILSFNILNSVAFSQEKPNIVLLFVDDYGWDDLGFRNPKFHTPNIDQLKADGIDFQRAYIPTPTCSPSRASLLTGKDAVRIQMVRHIPENIENGFTEGRSDKEFNLLATDPVKMESRNWLPLKEVTYAERLKEYGYFNMFIGKWHLGHEPYHPTKQGFDEQYGTTNEGHPKSYYPPYFRYDKESLKGFKKEDYLTDVLTERAESFIKNYDKSMPFMLTFWYYSVHGPHVGRKDWLNKYLKEGFEPKYANYAAMVSAMDESVGKVRAALKTKGIEKNTVILLISDQGGAFRNGHLSGGKMKNTLGEGGSRVPFIALVPGITKAGTSINTPVQSIDIYPTLIELASGKKCVDKGINGKSLMPLLKGKGVKSRPLFFFRSYEDQYTSVIAGDWKMIKYHSGKREVFNLKNDESENQNLAETNKKQTKHLDRLLIKWEDEVMREIKKY